MGSREERSCKQQNWNANGSVELSCLLMSGGFISARFRTTDRDAVEREEVWELELSHVWQNASGAPALTDPVIGLKEGCAGTRGKKMHILLRLSYVYL